MILYRTVIRLFYISVVACNLSGCASSPLTCYPPTPKQTGVLRVAEIMDLASGNELPESKRQILRSSGIRDIQIQSGSIGLGRVYCCGSDNEIKNILTIFIPGNIAIDKGDIVEVKMGEAPEESKPGYVNTAIRVREKNDGIELPRWGGSGNRTHRTCRWVPDKPTLWNRILYCDWMIKEGWVESKDILWKAWIKPQQ